MNFGSEIIMRHSYSKSMIQPETSMRGMSIEQLGSFAKQVFSNKKVDQRIPFKPPDIYKFFNSQFQFRSNLPNHYEHR